MHGRGGENEWPAASEQEFGLGQRRRLEKQDGVTVKLHLAAAVTLPVVQADEAQATAREVKPGSAWVQ